MAGAPPTDASSLSIIFTLILLEAALSFDNAAILAAITRRLPMDQRKRALNWGLGLAYGLRVAAIALVLVLVKYPVLKAIGGGYLIFLTIKHFWHVTHQEIHGEEPDLDGDGYPDPKPSLLEKWGMAPFTAAIVTIGTVDLAFAVDQVVAAVAFTENLWLIVIAATVGLLSLRILAPYLTRLMDWLPLLEHMAYVAVGFVGSILVYDWATERWFESAPHLDPAIKVGITVALFGLPALWRLTLGRNKQLKGHGHDTLEESLEDE